MKHRRAHLVSLTAVGPVVGPTAVGPVSISRQIAQTVEHAEINANRDSPVPTANAYANLVIPTAAGRLDVLMPRLMTGTVEHAEISARGGSTCVAGTCTCPSGEIFSDGLCCPPGQTNCNGNCVRYPDR